MKRLCAALGDFLLQVHGGEALGMDITKSCLLARLIYGGAALRTEPCPIHRGRWPGCPPEPCPAGCNYGLNRTGWLPATRH